ncbi:MAG: RDD family protein [Ignavibacteriae bacterium]|nr:RDD family protein [Ignavibacteriota bacterium]
MEYVRIDTTQNVAIDYEVANLGERIVASIIDYFILGAYIFATFILLFSYTDVVPFQDALIYILLLPAFFYDLLCEIALGGQSFGKKLMKIKVVRLDGAQPTFGNYLLRWLLRIIEGGLFCYGAVAMVVILINGKGQRLGDIAAGTAVIKIKPRVTLSEATVAEVQDTYTPQYPEAANLTDRDAQLIKDILRTSVRDKNYEMMLALSNKVEQILGVNATTDPETFLRTVLKDFMYYTQGI